VIRELRQRGYSRRLILERLTYDWSMGGAYDEAKRERRTRGSESDVWVVPAVHGFSPLPVGIGQGVGGSDSEGP